MSVNKYRIMIIDDEPIVVKRLKLVFEKMGYEVLVHTSGKEALETLEKEPFDIVITDLKMDIDGFEVFEKAKTLNPKAKIIIITGYADAQSARRAVKEGVFDFIPKPFRLDDLKKSVMQAIEQLENHTKGERF
ncbi:response regulator [Thermodesulfatator autotrophicus]|uniref:Histidine kinase n=1 Tax=Thermodesulfatator autotrophicus TaxID=1795632 RepID=A0A177E451_9BACT|nr:response regulator [Thermodesulfatator autotrophicus]OAG26747.1 histidine kinase [Thermodesulfatator autotrophicus]